MKKIVVCMITMLLVFGLAACGTAVLEESSHIPQLEQTGTEPMETGTLPEDVQQENEFAGTIQEKIPISESNEQVEDRLMRISVKSSEYEIIYELNDSQAARELYTQLPLELEAEPFSNNEIIFYPPDKLGTTDTPISSGEPGSLSYYEPWGDVVMFYAPCSPNGSLYELGIVISGKDDIEKLNGTITVSDYNELEEIDSLTAFTVIPHGCWGKD